MTFFQELRRRSVFRVAAGYVVASWLVIQVVSALSTPLNLPGWFETVVVMLLGIGFVVALVVAWAFELTPDGIKLTGSRPDETRGGTSKLDYALIVGLLLVASVSYLGNRSEPAAGSAASSGSTTIAVLPFADDSPEGEHEYFGDGIAEELINELSRLEGLQVAGRTSSFAFKNSSEVPQAIGEALGVETLLEGRIRIYDDRVDVRARLLNASDGFPIWVDDYEGELTDIFVIQEDIATSVAGSLGVTLGVGDVNSFKGAGTTNIQAYQAYLQGLALGPTSDAIPYFERATTLDPNYAVAWAQLGLRTTATASELLPEQGPAVRERALSFVERAVALDPKSAQAMSLLGTLRYATGRYIEGEQAHLEAISMLEDRGFFIQYGNLLLRTGRSSDAIEQHDRARALDEPLFRRGVNTWSAYVALGQESEARDAVEDYQDERTPFNRLVIALSFGDLEEVQTRLAEVPAPARVTEALFSPLASILDSPDRARELLRNVHEDERVSWPSKGHDVAVLAAYFGDPVLALDAFAEELRYVGVRSMALWYPFMREVRRLPGFKSLVAELGMVRYWRASGWPDVCEPVGNDDFVCR